MPYKDISAKRANDREYWQRVKAAGPVASAERRVRQLRERAPTGAPEERPAVTVKIPMPRHGLRVAYVPDPQIKDGVPLSHLGAYGRYIAAKRPDVVIFAGDWWDFPSLSFHNKPGSLALEGRRYVKDLDAGRRGLDQFMEPIHAAVGYKPALHFTLGNHDILPSRQAALDARLEGALKDPVEHIEQHGITHHPFLQPIVIGGVAFSHYFPSGPMGRPVTTAPALLRKLHMSAIAGHQQGRDIAYSRRADGATMTSIISGSFYQHDEDYLSPFQNGHWRGAWFLHEMRDGQFDEMALSLGYLLRKFGKVSK